MKSGIHIRPAIASARPDLSALALGLALLAAPLQAEDPLLGTIRLIKCVGCSPGDVNLIVHDPIDVRDYEVKIKEGDYQKIITPLAGKTIYDKGGCFYWMEKPRTPLKSPVPDSNGAAEPAKAREDADPEGTPSRCVPFERIQVKFSDDEDEGGRGKSKK